MLGSPQCKAFGFFKRRSAEFNPLKYPVDTFLKGLLCKRVNASQFIALHFSAAEVFVLGSKCNLWSKIAQSTQVMTGIGMNAVTNKSQDEYGHK
jgi:hypothetical protein